MDLPVPAQRRLIVGISGASGVVYGVRVLQLLRNAGVETHLVMSKTAELTFAYETTLKIADVRSTAHTTHDIDDMAASIAAHPTPVAYYHSALIEHATKNNEGAAAALKRALGLGLTKAQLCPFEQRQFERLAKSLKVALPKESGSSR